jgi:hypothetical protein
MVLQSVDHQSDAYIYHDIVILLLIDVHSFLALSVCSFILQSKRFMIPQPTMVKQCSLEDIFFSQFSGQLEVFISLVIQTSDICIVDNCDNTFNCCLSPCVYSFIELYVVYIVSISSRTRRNHIQCNCRKILMWFHFIVFSWMFHAFVKVYIICSNKYHLYNSFVYII